MYGMTRVNNRTQLSATMNNGKKKKEKRVKTENKIKINTNEWTNSSTILPACCSVCVRQLLSTARTNRSVAL